MFNEEQLVRRTWQAVEKKVGLHEDIPVMEFPPWEMGKTDVAVDHEYHALIFGPGLTTAFTTPQLEGIMAHEAGHVALGHLDYDPNEQSMTTLREWEDAADAFAKEKGFGKDLASALEKVMDAGQTSGDENDEHRSDTERIAFLLAKD
jgi:hypothetical protein